MYGRKRKYPSSSTRGQGASKRRVQGRGSYFRPARSWGGRSHSGYVPYRRSASEVIIRQPTGLPDRLRVKLIYRESLAFSQTSGDLADNVYRANSLYDPDATGAGGQPYLSDQWAAMYGIYTVIGCGIEVTAMAGGVNATNVRFGVTPTTTSTAFSANTQEESEERPYAKARSLQMGATGIGQGVIKSYMSTAKMNGIQRAQVETDSLWSGIFGNNPSNLWYWHVWNYVPSANTQSLQMIVKLTFYCVLRTRISPGLS